MEDKKALIINKNIRSFLDKGFLLSPDFLDDKELNFINEKFITNLKSNKDLVVLNKDIRDILSKKDIDNFNWKEFEKSQTLFEKQKNTRIYTSFMDYLNKLETKRIKPIEEIKEITPLSKNFSDIKSNIKITFSYDEESKKRSIQDFIGFYNSRFEIIKNMLKNRRELQSISSINRIKAKRDRESVSLIGMVMSKQTYKSGNLGLTIEDSTGSITVLINKSKRELYNIAKDIVLDDIIGVSGTSGNNIVFANNILLPDIPLNKELKKSPEEGYMIVLSDFHIGSNNFLEEEFNRFLDWIQGNVGNEKQKELASKIKYIFILGDLVDGIGIYPGQSEELVIKDIYEQYQVCADYLKKIPSHIQLIIIPGNHDAMRLAEPQPQLYKDLAAPIWELSNVTLLSNPSYVNIHSSENFSGFDILMYHGYSFTHYADVVESIRMKGGVDRADLIMKFLLQRRHLAPSHTSNLFIPDESKDSLVINKVPDFFLTGHLHKSVVANYRNTTMICGSCWQAKTEFMEKVGVHPEPAKVPIVNLQTREVKVLRFGK